MHCSRKVYVTSYATSVTANKTDSPERFQWFATFPCRETWNVRFPSDAKREKEDIIILGRVWHQSESSRQKKNARFIKISHLVYLNSTFYRLVCVVKSVNIRAISRQLIALYINWSARFFSREACNLSRFYTRYPMCRWEMGWHFYLNFV